MTRVRLSRRQFIQGLGALSILPIVACADGVEQTPSAISVTAPGGYLMPMRVNPTAPHGWHMARLPQRGARVVITARAERLRVKI